MKASHGRGKPSTLGLCCFRFPVSRITKFVGIRHAHVRFIIVVAIAVDIAVAIAVAVAATSAPTRFQDTCTLTYTYSQKTGIRKSKHLFFADIYDQG